MASANYTHTNFLGFVIAKLQTFLNQPFQVYEATMPAHISQVRLRTSTNLWWLVQTQGRPASSNLATWGKMDWNWAPELHHRLWMDYSGEDYSLSFCTGDLRQVSGDEMGRMAFTDIPHGLTLLGPFFWPFYLNCLLSRSHVTLTFSVYTWGHQVNQQASINVLT